MFIVVHRYLRSEIDGQNADKSITTSNIRKLLSDVLPNDLPSYIKHKIVMKRIHFLRTEFEWLLDDIRRSSNNDTKVTAKLKITKCEKYLRYMDNYLYTTNSISRIYSLNIRSAIH
jgi:hypothetical protein